MTDARVPRPLARFAPALVLLAALALRVREALRAPLWYDELYTQAAVNRPWEEVLRVMRGDVHPPLHFVLAHLWTFAGHSDLAVRGLGILAGLAGVCVAWGFARDLFGARAGLLTAALVALHPWHVYFSQEARSYPWLWLFLSISAWSAWRWAGRGERRDAVLFVLSSALALWTHYLAGIVLALQWVWMLARLRREGSRALAWTGWHVAVALLFAPVLPLWWAQLHRAGADHWLPRPSVHDLYEAARKLAFGASYLVPVVLLLACTPLTSARTRRAAVHALGAGLVPVLLCWTLGTAGVRVFAPKYMMFAIPSLCALIAAGTLRLPKVASAALAVALLALGLRAGFVRAPYPEADALGRTKRVLDSELRAGDVVFHADTHTLLFGERYYPKSRHVLLLMGQRLPYYEGGHLVPDSVRAEAGALVSAHDHGLRWFALAARPAGLDDRAAAALFEAASGAPAETLGVVRLWRGQPR
ncbi:MAG: glycosyltransferase family 39 protein [Candidatus Eisenbacteria bacterium]|uniref:Glycosyltransferase family 39 protein n=1 Tax=Eiseniibacteriota bacterium TaxID=2212470 RepID=A0A933W3Y5_UNCEI|nr:glycosyltransferase family 39 protein [Candidatus Eisenbacteria bacterium]